MALDANLIRGRLKEVFGTDSQDAVGKKLNMAQGNVSKWLSGAQLPTLETVYHIAKTYEVSIDWLMGLTNDKRLQKSLDEVNYTSAINTLHTLILHRALTMSKENGKTIMESSDPLINTLLKKSIELQRVDRELYEKWVREKLSLFEDRPIVWNTIWEEPEIDFLFCEASKEEHWLEVLDHAKRAEDYYDEIMRPEPGPFGD